MESMEEDLEEVISISDTFLHHIIMPMHQ